MNREDYIAKAPTFTIYDGFCKTKSVLENHSRIIVSVSGGSDSDDMVDIAEHLKPDDGCELIYVWFDTGIEMAATKRHLKYLQERYGIEIHTESGHKKVAAAVRSDGYPFMNKVVSEYIDRLQTHDFQWEDKPFDLDGIMFRSTHCFEIRTGCGWCVYTARLCGTYPVQAREGAIYNFPVVVETEHGGEAYTMPLTGQPTAGTFPAPAVQGVIAGENVAVATAENGQTYTSPMTGYATVGTHPAAAVQGSILDGVLMTDTASGSAGFEATPCGLEPGSLF